MVTNTNIISLFEQLATSTESEVKTLCEKKALPPYLLEAIKTGSNEEYITSFAKDNSYLLAANTMVVER